MHSVRFCFAKEKYKQNKTASPSEHTWQFSVGPLMTDLRSWTFCSKLTFWHPCSLIKNALRSAQLLWWLERVAGSNSLESKNPMVYWTSSRSSSFCVEASCSITEMKSSTGKLWLVTENWREDRQSRTGQVWSLTKFYSVELQSRVCEGYERVAGRNGRE